MTINGRANLISAFSRARPAVFTRATALFYFDVAQLKAFLSSASRAVDGTLAATASPIGSTELRAV